MRRYDEPVDEYAVSRCGTMHFAVPRIRDDGKALMLASLRDAVDSVIGTTEYGIRSATDDAVADASDDCEAEDY